MRVERMDHVVVVTKDLAATAKGFSEVLGTQFYAPIDMPGMRMVFDESGLEIMEATEPGNPVAERLEKYGEGVAWIAFKVTDLDETVTELRSKGIAVEYWGDCGEPTHQGDLRAARTVDPEKTSGVVFEFVEYAEVKPTALAMFNKLSEVPKM